MDQSNLATGLQQPPLFLTDDGAGKFTGISKNKLREMAEKGLCPPKVKVGGVYKWSRVLLEKWANAGAPRFADMAEGKGSDQAQAVAVAG